MDNIIPFTSSTTADLDPDKILDGAIGKLQSVHVIGMDHAGELYVASSYGYAPDILWEIEQAKQHLLKVAGK